MVGKPLNVHSKAICFFVETVQDTFGTVFLPGVPKMGLDLKDKVWLRIRISAHGTCCSKTPPGKFID